MATFESRMAGSKDDLENRLACYRLTKITVIGRKSKLLQSAIISPCAGATDFRGESRLLFKL